MTPDRAVRSLRDRLTKQVRAIGLHEDLASAALDRRSIRTHLSGAFESPTDGLALRAVNWDLHRVVTALSDDELGERARTFPFDLFEEGFL